MSLPRHTTRLIKLIRSLSGKESLFFKQISDASVRHLNKRSKLVDLITEFENRHPDDPVIARISKNRKSLEYLEERILDSLLMDVSIKRDDSDTPEYDSVRLQKKFLKAQVLLLRDIPDRAYKIAKSCALAAIQKEDYHLALQCFRLKLSMTTLHQTEGQFRELSQKIVHYENVNQSKNKAIRLFRELKFKRYLKLTENLDIFVKTSHLELEKLLTKVNSPLVHFVTMYFAKELCELEGSYNKALILARELQLMATQLENPYLLLRKEELLFEQGRLNYLVGNFSEGVRLLENSIGHLSEDSDCSQRAREMLFEIYFEHKKFQECKDLLENFTTTEYYKNLLPDQNKVDWLRSKILLHFKTGEAKSCLRAMDEVYDVGKPDDEHNLHFRIIKALCWIDLQKFDQADREIESLRKFIQRNNLTVILSELGLESTFDLLWQLRYCGYRFNLLKQRNIEMRVIYHDRFTFNSKNQDNPFKFLDLWAWIQSREDCLEQKGTIKRAKFESFK